MRDGSEVGLLRQVGILFHRDVELFLNDRKRVAITMILPILIGLVITLVSGDDMGKIYESTRATMFTIICAGIYVGMFNSLPLVCKERSIIKREYMTGMKISSYIIAMTFFQAIISLVQTLLFMVIYWMPKGINLPEKELILGSPFLEYTITLFLIMFAADMMGLLISSIVRNNELANLIAPIVIIFQLVMSGVLFELGDKIEKVANLTVSKWGMQALGAQGGLYKMTNIAKDKWPKQAIDGLTEDVKDELFKTDIAYEHTAGNLCEAWLWLLIFIIVLAILSTVFLRRVKKDRR